MNGDILRDWVECNIPEWYVFLFMISAPSFMLWGLYVVYLLIRNLRLGVYDYGWADARPVETSPEPAVNHELLIELQEPPGTAAPPPKNLPEYVTPVKTPAKELSLIILGMVAEVQQELNKKKPTYSEYLEGFRNIQEGKLRDHVFDNELKPPETE